MELKNDFLTKLVSKKDSGLTASINDLREKELSGVKLNHEEKTALSNFDRYRMSVLNAQKNDDDFHHRYRQFQVIANLSNWREFLGEEFFQ